MKIFFEEYGMVIVVTVLALGMITFANEFKGTLGESIESQWEAIVCEAEGGGGGD